MLSIAVAPHPLLDLRAFTTTFPAPLAEVSVSDAIRALLVPGASAPIHADDAVRSAVRDLLRHGGYKPTGRAKPASEYLLRAVGEGALASINAAVDACNAASFHSGLPVSVVDGDRAMAPYSIALAPSGASYVFNAAGQTIDLGGLVVLADAEGPCANAVKDAQRTKTHGGTTRTLSIVWGTNALQGHSAQTVAFYRELLASVGATTEDVAVTPA